MTDFLQNFRYIEITTSSLSYQALMEAYLASIKGEKEPYVIFTSPELKSLIEDRFKEIKTYRKFMGCWLIDAPMPHGLILFHHASQLSGDILDVLLIIDR